MSGLMLHGDEAYESYAEYFPIYDFVGEVIKGEQLVMSDHRFTIFGLNLDTGLHDRAFVAVDTATGEHLVTGGYLIAVWQQALRLWTINKQHKDTQGHDSLREGAL